MSDQAPPRLGQRIGRVLGHAAVVIGILAVIAAAFALSYDSVRDIARAAGVPATLARIYPGIFDAVFLVACAAALMLRDARWWTRLYSWLAVLVTGGLIAAADVYHEAGLRLPHRIAAGTIAALPWALVMLAFSLWLSMLRHARSGRPRPLAVAEPAHQDEAAGPALALEAAPAARAALPAAELAEPAAAVPSEPVPDPAPAEVTGSSATTESVNNLEGDVPQSAAPAGATADGSLDGPADRSDHAARNGDGDDHSKDDGDVANDDVLGDQVAEPPSPTGPHPSDADTPPYGFPAVTGHAGSNGSAPAPRTPTLLSAPVPADVADPEPPAADAADPESAEAAEETESAEVMKPTQTTEPAEPSAAAAEPEDIAAKGRPPAASAELPVTEAELAHDDRPADGAKPSAADQSPQEEKPAAGDRPHRPFERVRSTPTPPRN
jgi:hypothetical protein